MANPEPVEILKQGTEVWNAWRKANPLARLDLGEANLIFANLNGANLSEANLSKVTMSYAKLNGANLYRANLSHAHLSNADLSNSNLNKVNLSDANLREADVNGSKLRDACLVDADLRWANLSKADLIGANLSGADLTNAKLERSILIGTTLQGATLTGCRIYGVSAWNVNLKDAKQSNLIITPQDEPEITVDNLQVAQFIYLLLNNSEIRHVIDTITSKAVLILGQFTDERKAVLDAIRDELRKRDYLPIVFDFEKSGSRDLTETISTLAHMARFIIADITNAKSIPQELQAIVPNLPSLAVQPIILYSQREYAMFEHFKRYPWVLPIYQYDDTAQLLASLTEKIIEPAEAKVKELRSGK